MSKPKTHDKSTTKPSVSRRGFARQAVGALAGAALAGGGAAKAQEETRKIVPGGEPSFKTNVTKQDIEFLDKVSVAIKSNGLLNTFVRDSSYGLGKLADAVGSSGVRLSVDDVSTDDRGRIIITNEKFVRLLRAKVEGMKTTGDTNYVCKNAYKCGGAVKYQQSLK